ncbi:MAG: hypothetical protein KDA53_00610 [Hyphomonas sp.]|nr:hypothetical protein [Hyphomonas sp.]
MAELSLGQDEVYAQEFVSQVWLLRLPFAHESDRPGLVDLELFALT